MREINGFFGQWDDLYGDMTQAVTSTASSLLRENWNTMGFQLYHFRDASDDELTIQIQLTHKIPFASTARIHLHCIPAADPGVNTRVIKFNYWYSLVNIGSAFPTTVAGYSATSNVTYNVVTADYLKHKLYSIVNVPIPAGTPASSIIWCRIQRPASTDVIDTYSDVKGWGTGPANLALLFVDAHVQAFNGGTLGELA